MSHSLMLISITGRDKPGITSALAAVLAQHHIRLRDIEQVTNGGNLNMSIVIRLDPSDTREHPVFKDLIYTAWELGVHADFHPLTEADVAPDTSSRAYVLTLFASELSASAIATVAGILAGSAVNIEKIHKLSADRLSCIEMILSADDGLELDQLKLELLPRGKETGFNLALQRESVYRRAKRLLVLDVDSTLIEGEIIDELAERLGIGAKVSEITDRAMHGEIDFKESLRQRVALLKGCPLSLLSSVRENIKLTPGSEKLIRAAKRLGYKVAVISGGFSYFTNRLRATLRLDYAYANELEIREQRLTGRLHGPIVDGERKADLLETIAQGEGVSLEQVIAVGDGANDLHMLQRAGMGIAFNAKKPLREVADHSLDGVHLDSILYLLGIRGNELEELLQTEV